MDERQPRRPQLRRTLGLLALALAVPLVVVVVNASLQRQLIYYPDTSPAGSAAAALPGAEDVVLTTEDGLELDAWLVPPATADRGVAVLVAPGNAGNRAGRAPLASALAAQGFTVLLLDYRGYGGNPGSPSEQGLAMDARAAATFLSLRGFAPGCTIYYGESLGTGVVARLTTTHPPAGVVLRSPYPRFAAVAKVHYPWLPVELILVDRFPALDDLSASNVPVVVLAGSADDIIPSRLSEELAEGVGSLHAKVIVANAGHNDPIWHGPFVAERVATFADEVAQRCR